MSITRFAVVAILILSAWGPGRAQPEATCLAPALHVSIDQATLDNAAAGSPTLHLSDPNPPAQVSGYNIYRSATASVPASSWTLLGFNVMDEDAATPLVQWSDPTGDVSATGIYYYLAAAYNGPCDTEGPWKDPTVDDGDEDGIPDGEDSCPATPTGAPHYLTGCSASDLLIRPELLVNPIGEDMDSFAAALGAVTPPPDLLPTLAEAELSLDAVFEDMHAAMPCVAATNFSMAVAFLNDALVVIEDHIATLPPTPESTGGDDHWPSDEHRLWSGHHFRLSLVAMDAQIAADTTQAVCNSQGATTNVDGVVYEVNDGRRYLQVGNQPMVMAWDMPVLGGGDVSLDVEVSVTATFYDGVLVATQLNTSLSPFPFLGGLTYDGCAQLRVLPVQPLPGDPHPQPSWDVHPLDGYLQGGKLELAPGTRLMVEDSNCPGVIPDGAGPGQDLKIDYHYELYLNYQPKQGAFVNALYIGHALRGDSAPIYLPAMDPGTDGTLFVTQYKQSCVDNGNHLPAYNGQFEQIGQRTHWESCSTKEAVNPTQSYPLRMREMTDYCDASYSDVIFDIEDDEDWDWRETRVVGVTTDPSLVPGPVSFAAVGDPVVNSQPAHEGAVGLNQNFAAYNPWGHQHLARGTNRQSGLDWPHITGTRSGQPFRYPCGVPRLVTDSINFCGGNPQSYYRLPFPQGGLTQVGQGNGDPNRMGPGSHDSWQEFALDLGAQLGSPLRAARGGKILMLRDNFGINCKAYVNNECVESGACKPLSLPDLHSYGNYVAIEHQDGTIAWYAHLLDGSLGDLQVGEKVRRGDPIGQTGNTGSSCGPHLHYHVTVGAQNLWLADTVRVLYQAYDNQSQQVEDCMIPLDDQWYVSTNLP